MDDSWIGWAGRMLGTLERLVVATDVAQDEHVPVTLVGDAVVPVNAGVEYVPMPGQPPGTQAGVTPVLIEEPQDTIYTLLGLGRQTVIGPHES